MCVWSHDAQKTAFLGGVGRRFGGVSIAVNKVLLTGSRDTVLICCAPVNRTLSLVYASRHVDAVPST